jgi:hypothetical protein
LPWQGGVGVRGLTQKATPSTLISRSRSLASTQQESIVGLG